MTLRFKCAAFVAALAFTGTFAQTAEASVAVGTFTSEKTCTTYELEWGREFAAASSSSGASGGYVAGNYGAAGGYSGYSRSSSVYAREWGTELRRECVQNFPQMRSTIASALASAGPVYSDGSYTLTGRITDVGYDAQTVDTKGSSIVDQYMVVSVEFQVRSKTGKVVYGGALTKRLNILTGTETAEVSYARAQSGRTTFSQIQQQIGFAVARAVIFHFNPLRVVDNDGKSIALNFGAPLVPLGSAVIVATASSLQGRRLTVTSSMSGRAVATSDANIPLRDVPIGSPVTFAESDDPAANSRVYERVELPEN